VVQHCVGTCTPCHKRRNIRSYRLTSCYGLHQKTSFASIQPHNSAHSGDFSTQRPALPSWPSIRSFTWQGLETSSWSSSRAQDRLTPRDTGSVPANLWRQAILQRDGPSWLLPKIHCHDRSNCANCANWSI